MTGNMHKTKWNKPGGARSGGNMKDAVTLEDAVMGVNIINKRIRREKNEARIEAEIAAKKARITLPKTPWDNEK